MNKTTSVYLDLIRFLAGLAVLLGHASYARFRGEWLQGIGFLKHDAVIVFFVLSGYVIAYVATHKEDDIIDYSISRFARLYSVVLPALLLTVFLDNWGALLDPQRYSGYAYDMTTLWLGFFRRSYSLVNYSSFP
jgi:peptidoglycan/LPS O-acetylase OafA/YrhL